MSFINNFKIKNKLILMLIFPVLGLLYFSVNGIWEKYTTARAMRDVQNLSRLAVNISTMVHELQKERGATGVFVGSKGAKFASELSEQRSEADRRVSDLQTFLSAFQKDRYGAEFKKLLETALGSLEEIKTKRGMASALTISGDEIVSYYTKMIGQFYDPVSYMTRISANADIAVAVAVYANFLFAKEKTGIERAILTHTFGTDSFGPGVFKKLVSAVSAQETYLSMFLFVANAEQKDFYKSKVHGQVVSETEKMRDIAFDKAATGKFGIESPYWFKMQTAKINLLKEVEDKLTGDLLAVAEGHKSSAEKVLAIYVILTIIAVVVAIILAYVITRSITKPLARIEESSKKLANGELNVGVSIKSRDEIGELGRCLNEAAKGMKDIILRTKGLSLNVDTAVKMIGESVSSIKGGSEDHAAAMTDVSASIEELHKIAQDIAKGMEQLLKLSEDTSSSILEMAASVEEVDGSVADLTVAVGDTYSSIEEIAGSLKEVAAGVDNISTGADETASSLIQIDASAMEIEKHAREGAELSNEVAVEGEKGVKVVELTHAGMEKIKESVNSLAAVIDELGRRSKEIGKIVNVIDDVAMETNLLALNATILAAQAGEHGKGFSVVADEIRELSERTAASTTEITGIVSGIQGQIEKAVASVEEGMAKVVEGEKLSTETTLVLKGITGRFKTFQSMSLEIAKATKEQASGSKQVMRNIEGITNTIHQMARATQEQSQGAGQVVKAVEKMRELASQIKKATAEQAQGSKIIASNTENVMKSIEEINAVSSRQESENQRISATVIETTTSATKGMENARMLEEMASMLKKEMDNLKQGLEKFKLGDSGREV